MDGGLQEAGSEEVIGTASLKLGVGWPSLGHMIWWAHTRKRTSIVSCSSVTILSAIDSVSGPSCITQSAGNAC
jgi:hypothetical protein